MNQTMMLSEQDLIAELQSPEAEVRKKAARELGYLVSGDDQEASALMDVMQNDCDDKVREMAYWALSSPANLTILDQHPEWQARVQPAKGQIRKKTRWWLALISKLKITRG